MIRGQIDSEQVKTNENFQVELEQSSRVRTTTVVVILHMNFWVFGFQRLEFSEETRLEVWNHLKADTGKKLSSNSS